MPKKTKNRMGQKSCSARQKITTAEIHDFLKGKVVVLDCGHRYSLHPLSNTFIMTAYGRTMCHECY